MDISPLSPELKQQIDNQGGKIDDIRNNQNGLMLELGKISNQTEINARDIGQFQQGMMNNQNSGVQILQGDGALILVFSVCVIGMFLVYHYRTVAKKKEKAADIMAQQIALYDDVALDDQVFLAAMNTDAEEEVYGLMVKGQKAAGVKKS